MRSLSLILVASLAAWTSAIPITPAAPRLQRKVEQIRLEGWSEFMVARLAADSATASELHPYPVHINKNPFFRSPTFEEDNDPSGDIIPGSLDSPQILSYATINGDDDGDVKSLYNKICTLFYGRQGTSGRKRNEIEIRRPRASSNWQQTFGLYRR